jgi:hypothetical protein
LLGLSMTFFIMECWLPVPGFEGLYEISDRGRVFGLTSRRCLKPQRNALGYPVIGLWKNNKRVLRHVHTLIAAAFLGPRPFEHAEVRHLDGNPGHCFIENLAYGTRSENQQDRIRHGRHNNLNKTHCPQGHEYTPENIRIIPSRPRARYCRACKKDRRKLLLPVRALRHPPARE